MTTVIRTYQILVKAPVQSAFDYVSDLTRHPEWSGADLRITAISSGPIAVGKEYTSHGAVATQKNRPNQLKVTQYNSPKQFSFVAKDPDFGDVKHDFTFTEHGGGVIIQRTVTLSLAPVTAFMFRLFINPLVGKPLMDRALSALQANLEK